MWQKWLALFVRQALEQEKDFSYDQTAFESVMLGLGMSRGYGGLGMGVDLSSKSQDYLYCFVLRGRLTVLPDGCWPDVWVFGFWI